MCIYPPESREEQLGRHLGYFGIQGIEPSTELSSKSLVEIVEAVHDQAVLPSLPMPPTIAVS